MEKELQYLLDRRAIEDQIIRYAFLIDSKGFENLDEVMTADAFIDYSASGGSKAKGRLPEMKKYLKKSMAAFASQHLMTNISCEISPDRSSAASRHLLFNPLTIKMGGEDYTMFQGLAYNCKWLLQNGVWKISEMVQSDGYKHNFPKGK